MKRHARIIPAAEWLRLSHADRDRLLKHGHRPGMAGAETPPASDPPKTDPPPATDPPKTDPPADDPPKTDPPKDDPPQTDPPAGMVQVAKAEYDALKRDVAEMRRAAKRAEDDKKAADERAKAEQGRYRELWEAEKQRADGLQGTLEERDRKDAETARKNQYINVARRVGFKDPEAAYAILAYRENAGSDDDNVIEHELTKLRDEKVLPVDERKRTGADITAGAGGDTTDVTPGRHRIRMARGA